jgi:hypothetical protein
LSRNLAFIATLMDSGMEFIAACDWHAPTARGSWQPQAHNDQST